MGSYYSDFVEVYASKSYCHLGFLFGSVVGYLFRRNSNGWHVSAASFDDAFVLPLFTVRMFPGFQYQCKSSQVRWGDREQRGVVPSDHRDPVLHGGPGA
jgi:hypothetical protein